MTTFLILICILRIMAHKTCFPGLYRLPAFARLFCALFVIGSIMVPSLAPSSALAEYVVLGGTPVTRGQLRVERLASGGGTGHNGSGTGIRSESDAADASRASAPKSGDLFILKHTHVDVEITGIMARVKLKQSFENPYPDRLEALYVFPLPEDAAVDGYRFRIGETLVTGVVKKKEEARQEYEQAKQEGRKAGLLEQERPDIFTQSLANIPPGETVVVNIEYVHPVKTEGAHYLFSFPSVVAPRYIPGAPVARPNLGRGWANDTDIVPDASRIMPQYLPPGMRDGRNLTMEIRIDAGMPIQKITEVTHELDIEEKADTTARVRLKRSDVIANKDVVIQYTVGGERTALASLTHRDPNGNGHGYVSLVLQPPHQIERAEIMPREVNLVIDTSGSMKGLPMEQAKSFARHVLSRLNPQDTFRIIAFSNDVSSFHRDPLPASPEDIRRGDLFVQRLRSKGGTEMLKAFKEIQSASAGFLGLGSFGTSEEDAEAAVRRQYLVLITDALVGDDKRILSYIQKSNLADFRIFPIAIGPAPNGFLIARAAEIGRGFSVRVTNQDNADAMAAEFAGKISLPVVTDLQIDWGGLDVTDVQPSPLPDLYGDRPLTIIARYGNAGSANIRLTGMARGQEIRAEMPLALPETEAAHDSLAPMWARAKIRSYMNADIGNPGPDTVAAVTKLGLQYQLVTDYTSFIAVEEKIPAQIVGKLRTRQVLSAIPEGMEHLFGQPGQMAGAGNETGNHSRNIYGNTGGESDLVQPKVAAAVPNAARPTATAAPRSSAPVRRAAPATRSSSGSSRSSGSRFGGGAIDPITLLMVAVLVLGAMARRKKAGKPEA